MLLKLHAGMAELADALDLGSSSNGVGVQVLFPAPTISTQVSLCVFLCPFLSEIQEQNKCETKKVSILKIFMII